MDLEVSRESRPTEHKARSPITLGNVSRVGAYNMWRAKGTRNDLKKNKHLSCIFPSLFNIKKIVNFCSNFVLQFEFKRMTFKFHYYFKLILLSS